MKEVLLLTQFFPPAGGAGVQRVTKFAKFLPLHGWRPSVVTRSRPLGPPDRSLCPDVDAVEVRTSWVPGPPWTWRQSVGLRRLASRLWDWLSVPDAGIWWVPGALLASWRTWRRREISVLYATGGPFSTLILGVLAKACSGLPLVVDLRDPWTRNPRRFPRRWYVAWRDPLEKLAERLCLRFADRIVCVNPEMVSLLVGAFDTEKVRVIANGYDPEDALPNAAETATPSAGGQEVVVGYVGSWLDEFRLEQWFVPAFNEFAHQMTERGQTVRFDVTGSFRPLETNPPPLLAGFVDHGEAVAAMHRASILLLFSGGHAHDQSSKVFEYLATSAKIVAFVSQESAAARTLAGVEGCWTSPPFDEAAASRVLLEAASAPSPRSRDRTPFRREDRAAELAEVFDELVAPRGPR
ncbi:MAG: glycosyltransferase [Acidobacteriota bacterium]